MLQILERAFALCYGLTSIKLSQTLTRLGDAVFQECHALNAIAIPPNVTTIGDAAFQGCHALNAITIPQNVSTIGDEAFEECTALANMEIPNGITSVGYRAFYGCDGLVNVTVGNSVTNIGAQAFIVCSLLKAISVDAANPAYSSLDGVLYNKNKSSLLVCPEAMEGEFTIPNGVFDIGGLSFSFCRHLTRLTFPSSVSNINYFALAYCDKLSEIFFRGNCPTVQQQENFLTPRTVYFLPGTSGWSSRLAGYPTAPWPLPQPIILTLPPDFGPKQNEFSFRVSWATNLSVVIEACTDLTAQDWVPTATNSLQAVPGWFSFSDPGAKSPNRIYRVRQQ
jgi:hypothetical protein